MFEFNLNVYETFERIHRLTASSNPDDASAMDRAEYSIQLNKLVEGLVEILQHAAEHKLISLDIGEYDHALESREIGVYRNGADEPAANHTVAIRVPEEYLHDSVSEAIESFNLPTVEITADLALAAMAHQRFVDNDDDDLDERLFEAWAVIADRLLPRVVPSVQRLDAAGLIRIRELRTKRAFFPASVTHDAHGSAIEIAIAIPGEPPKEDAPATRAPRRGAKKSAS